MVLAGLVDIFVVVAGGGDEDVEVWLCLRRRGAEALVVRWAVAGFYCQRCVPIVGATCQARFRGWAVQCKRRGLKGDDAVSRFHRCECDGDGDEGVVQWWAGDEDEDEKPGRPGDLCA